MYVCAGKRDFLIYFLSKKTFLSSTVAFCSMLLAKMSDSVLDRYSCYADLNLRCRHVLGSIE